MLLAARYVLPISSPAIDDGAVLVRGEDIVDVGTRDELSSRYPDEEVRDFGRAVILPGFVDLHTHLEYSAFRGLVDDLPYTDWKIALTRKEKDFGPADWENASALGAMEAVSSGITTIADITATGASARSASEAGLRGVIYRELETMHRDEIDGVIAAAAEDVQAWSELDERLTVGLAPHSPFSCHPRLIERASEWAIRDGLKVSMHLAGSADEYDFVKYGSSGLATDFPGEWRELDWLPTGVSPVRYVLQWGLLDVPELLAVHLIQVDDDDIELLGANDIRLAYCPRCAAKLGMGRAPIGRYMAWGMHIGFGTDSPASNNTIDFFDEMRIGLLLNRAVIGEEEFFPAELFVEMATLGGARALGVEERVGSLEEGKAADLIVVDLSHSHQAPLRNPYSALVHTANQENVVLTMVGGRILYEAGTYLTVDEERVLARAEETRARLTT
jgi:5-methylthioadenosine/S-adenosylhomocysteine deaminase